MNKPQIVVLAAGMGNRYGGLKQMDPIGPNGEVLLDYSLRDAMQAGFERVVFVIREDFEEAFRSNVGESIEKRAEVRYSFQTLEHGVPDHLAVPENRSKPWGTGHAILCAETEIDAPFAVINADDYYGEGAFQYLYNHLINQDKLSGSVADHCMVGYPLHKTLSEHGTVSRGLCDIDEDGMLVRIEEQENICSREGAVVCQGADGSWEELPSDTIVSMNCWGFARDLIPQLKTSFDRFLESHGDDPEAEFYITTVINRLLQDGSARVTVYRTKANWFGVTYGEDQEFARQEIRERIDRGQYDSPLWNS